MAIFVCDKNAITEGRTICNVEAAAWILENCKYPRQRSVNKNNLAILISHYVKGTFTAATQIFFGRLGDEIFLLNGQHRLTAVVETGIPQEFQVQVKICNTMEEVDIEYSRFDTDMKTRSMRVTLTARGIGTQHGVSSALASNIVKASMLIAAGFSFRDASVTNRSSSMDEKLEYAEEWWKEANDYQSCISAAKRPESKSVYSKLCSARLASIGLVTLRGAHKKAILFWTSVAEDSGLKRGDPAKALLDCLKMYNPSTPHPTHNATFFCAPIIAWNCHMRGSRLNSIKTDGINTLKIDGTPYTITDIINDKIGRDAL